MFTNSRFASISATVAGLALAVAGVILVTDTPSSSHTTVGIEHLSIGGLSVACFALVLPTLYLGRLGDSQRAAAISCTGAVLLAVLTIISNIRGEDLGIFPAVAVPANLMIFGGFVAVAFGLRRRAHVPAALAAGMPASWILALPLSVIGGTVFAGAFWMTIGYLIAHDAIGSAEAQVPAPAQA